MRAWELEFMVEDVNLYSALARRDAPAGGLRLATGDRPGRSARYRDVLRPNGFGDELRAVLRADGSPWALLSLFRATGSAPFDAHDSGLMLFASSGELVSVNDDARAWLGELAGDGASATSSTCRSRSRSSAR